MASYKFLIESPSKEDLFDSKSHEKTAKSVFNTLEQNNDINLVGIEGELGSGKSTVVELVKKYSSETDYKFIEFDVERYQHGATKKALIETIYNAINPQIEDDADKKIVKQAKDVALGNYFEYSAEVRSNISIWVIWFGVSLLLATRVFIEALTGIGNFFTFIWDSLTSISLASHQVDYFAIISILVVCFPFYIVRCGQKQKPILWIFGTPPTTGDIFKRNSTDTVRETIEINKEVGAYELQQALQVFVDKLPTESKFILVIDNLDRVTQEKLREVWSDIEVFTSIAHNKIQLILPYSRSHIADSLVGNIEEGREFISKRIPVTFRVSPIITADWKMQCERMIVESLGKTSIENINPIIQLFSIWSDLNCRQITPRHLKKVINSVVSIMTTDTEQVNLISAFFYQLTTQQCDLNIIVILNKIVNFNDKVKEDKYQSKLDKSWELIEKNLSFDVCSKDLVSIHFQTKFEIAESELLKSPLETALENGDVIPFLEKQNIYAYSKIITEILDEKGTEDFIVIINAMNDNNTDSSKKWITNWLPKINDFIEKENHSIRNFDNWIDAFEEVINMEIIISKRSLETEFSARNKINEESIKLENLLRLHKLCSILKITPEIIKNFKADLFIKCLWNNRHHLKNWGIDKIIISEKQVDEIFIELTRLEKIDSTLLGRISNIYHLGWGCDLVAIKEKLPSITTLEELKKEPEKIKSNIYSAIWYNQDLCNEYYSLVTSISDENTKNILSAQAIANMIYHQSYQGISNFQDHIDLESDFCFYLADYLAISCDFQKIMDALKQPSIQPYIKDALKELIVQKRINRLSISNTIKDFELLQALSLSDEVLINWLSGWVARFNFNLSELVKINNSFVSFIFKLNSKDAWHNKIIEILSNDSANKEWWIEQIKKPNKNVQTIFEDGFKDGVKFTNCKNLSTAIKFFFSFENEIELKIFNNKNWIETLLCALPKASIDSISRSLEKELNNPKVSTNVQISIITNFMDRVSFIQIQSVEEQRNILTLFENASIEHENWFDNQEYNFSKWNKESLTIFAAKLMELEESGFSFNKLNKNKSIKNVKNELSKGDEKSETEE
jgi:hypothetical protein